jgi:hypothetical protein
MPLILPIATVKIDPNASYLSPNKSRRKSDNHQHDRDMLHNFFKISQHQNENKNIDDLFRQKSLKNKHQAYIYCALKDNNKEFVFGNIEEYLQFLEEMIDRAQIHQFDENIPGDLDKFLKSYVNIPEASEAEEKSYETSTLEGLEESEDMGQDAHIKGNAAVNGTEVFDMIPKASEKSDEKSKVQELNDKLNRLGADIKDTAFRIESLASTVHDGNWATTSDLNTTTEGKESDTIHGTEEKTQDQPISNDQNKNHDFILAMCLTLLALSCVMLYWVPIKLLLVKIIPLPQLSSFLMSTAGNAISKILFGLVVLLPMMLLSYQNNNSTPLTVDSTTDHNFAKATDAGEVGEVFDRVTGKQAKPEEKFENDKPGNKA